MVVGWAWREQGEIPCRALLAGAWGAWLTAPGSDTCLALGPRGLELGGEAEDVIGWGRCREEDEQSCGTSSPGRECVLRCCCVTNGSSAVDGSRCPWLSCLQGSGMARGTALLRGHAARGP